MLIPAIIKKAEILENFKKYYYTEDMMYETGGLNNWLPNIQEETETGRLEKSYDKFCNKFNGTKHILKDAIKDKYGKYHDDIIYEIINKSN